MHKWILRGLALTCVLLPGRVIVAQGSSSDNGVAARSFVQGFYDWYWPIALKDNDGLAWYAVLQSRESALSPELAAGLRADSSAKEHQPSGETIGVNADPFLASQDPCGRFQIAGVHRKGANYAVTVHPICASEYKSPDVVAEVARRGNTWQFVNFFYQGTNLRKLLCDYAHEAAAGRKIPRNLRC